MEDTNKIALKLKLDLLSTLWQEFCEKHTELYELTCDEYMHLLSSDLELLEETVDQKAKLLDLIAELENHRQEVTAEVAQLMNIETPTKLGDLLVEVKKIEELEFASRIEKLNLVLLDIIEKIQDQNKKNQVFLNKAIHSLRELKESFTGKTNYKTYSSKGMTKSNLSL